MKLRVLAEAEAELLAATRYYEERREGLGLDFYDRVSECMAAIAQEPLRFPLYEGEKSKLGVRRMLVERFPYVVVYRVLPTEILVVAVAHASRRPGYWARRTN